MRKHMTGKEREERRVSEGGRKKERKKAHDMRCRIVARRHPLSLSQRGRPERERARAVD